ncbi:hypothetical protein B1A_08309, partial [mine drainage metagenome]
RYLNVGSYPFAVALADGGKRLVVSDWGGNGVSVIDRAAWKVLGEVPDRAGAGSAQFRRRRASDRTGRAAGHTAGVGGRCQS